MTPIWVISMLLMEFSLCQFQGFRAGIPCGWPAIPKHGSCKIFGRVAYYTCDRGFAMVGKARSVCTANYHWQFPAPYCVAIYFGPKGPKGTRGPVGMKGDKGDDGQPGPPGWRGRSGTPGMLGPVGAPGPDGLPGRAGQQGPMGFPGPSGTNGQNGQPGSKGDRGAPGMKGYIGANGPQGPRGMKGDLGPRGIAGANAVTSTSAFSVALGSSNPSPGSPIIWQRPIYNGDRDFQARSGTFLCRIPGLYHFTYIFQVNTKNAYVIFRINGAYVWSTFQSFNSSNEIASASLIITLNHSDKVWLEIKDNYNGVAETSTLLGHLISPSFIH